MGKAGAVWAGLVEDDRGTVTVTRSKEVMLLIGSSAGELSAGVGDVALVEVDGSLRDSVDVTVT